MGEQSVLGNVGLRPIAVGGMAAVAPRAARLPHWSILASLLSLLSPYGGGGSPSGVSGTGPGAFLHLHVRGVSRVAHAVLDDCHAP